MGSVKKFDVVCYCDYYGKAHHVQIEPRGYFERVHFRYLGVSPTITVGSYRFLKSAWQFYLEIRNTQKEVI